MSTDVTRATAAIRPVVWSVVCDPPDLVRHCPGCKDRTAFRTSQRFRVNGNGRRLDVWLIYRCVHCEATHNLTVHTRMRPTDIGLDRLVDYERNDAQLASAVATDPALLRATGAPLLHRPTFEVLGPALTLAENADGHDAEFDVVAVRVIMPRNGGVRLDRVLAHKLALSRSQVAAAIADGRIRLPQRTTRSCIQDTSLGVVCCRSSDQRSSSSRSNCSVTTSK